MRTELPELDVSFFRENGYLVVPDFLGPDELATWRDAVDEAVDERGDRALPKAFQSAPVDQPSPQITEEKEYYRRVFTQRVNLWQESDKLRRLMLDEQLGKLIADLAGVDGIRVWHDQALIKEPYANFTAYHLDNPYHSFSSANEVSMWVALDDATLENGCLYYVPGTHKAEKYESVKLGKDLGAVFDVYPEWKEIAPVACPVPAGGACFHNGLTVHGAGANMTPGRRRAMACIYMPEGSTFNGKPNVLPPSYVATLEAGDVLENDDQNPLIFSRTGKPTGALTPVG